MGFSKMDMITAAYLMLFVGSMGLDLNMFETPEDDESDLDNANAIDAGDEEGASLIFDADAYNATITGTAADDTLTAGEEFALAFFLGEGDDSLDASAGDDYAEGGAGDDSIFMREGQDIVQGGAGNDTIDAGVGYDLAHGDEGNDLIHGNMGDDTLYGDDGSDTVLGGSGADLIYGGAGDDTLSGLGVDLSTADASPTIDGIDTLYGGAGNDTILIGPGDIASGGAGDDLFQIDASRDDLTNVSQIIDFTPGDAIDIRYTQQFDTAGLPEIPQLDVRPDDSGTSGLIQMNGALIAKVVGGQSLTIADLRLIAA